MSGIPVTARSAAVVRGPMEKTETLDVSAWQNMCTPVSVGTELQSCDWAGFLTRTKVYLQTQFLVSSPALMSYVRDVDDDQISFDINF